MFNFINNNKIYKTICLDCNQTVSAVEGFSCEETVLELLAGFATEHKCIEKTRRLIELNNKLYLLNEKNNAND